MTARGGAVVLVVDDEPRNRKLLAAPLAAEGYQVLTARNGVEALAIIRDRAVDAVLLDVMMPEMDGIEVTRRLKRDRATANIPIIVLTALDDRDVRHRALSAGAEDFLAKPADRLEVSARLRNLIRLKVATDRLAQLVDAQAEQLAAIARTANDAILLADAGGMIAFANAAAERIFGYGPGELVNQALTCIIPERDRPAHRVAWARLQQDDLSDVSGRTIELIGLRKDGSEFPVEQGLSVWRSDGELYACGVLRDITERKASEVALAERTEQLRQAQKMEALGALAGGVAHDFNNLLTTIMAFAQFALNDLPDGDPRRDDIGEVLNAADSAATLTGQLLAFSRRRPIEPVVLELNAAVGSVEKMLRRTLPETIELVVLPTDEHLPILFDPGQLDQLVFNLAVNARDAMPQGGTLTIELSRRRREQSDLLPEGDYALLAVSDTGNGIPDEAVERIFEPFFSTKGEKGTGLGLATCFGIVRQAGGDILVKSSSTAGTEFSLWLPLTDQVVTGVPRPRLVRDTRVRSGWILLVEDQPAILRVASRALTAAGYHVCTAHTAEEAVSLFAQLPRGVDLLVTDVVLPGLSGVSLAQQLRRSTPDLPVVFMSGYMSDEPGAAIRSDAVTRFLPKPFSAPELLAKIDLLLEEVGLKAMEGR